MDSWNPRRRRAEQRAIGSSTTPATTIVKAQWVSERRRLQRFRVEQPPYSILNRAIESEVLPALRRYGMGAIVWGPLGQGMLTGRVRKRQQTDVVRARFLSIFGNEQRFDAVERLVALAGEAGLPMTHLAMAFAIAHPAVNSALLGPRTMEQLDDLLAGMDVVLCDDVRNEIVAQAPTPERSTSRRPSLRRSRSWSCAAGRSASAPRSDITSSRCPDAAAEGTRTCRAAPLSDSAVPRPGRDPRRVRPARHSAEAGLAPV